MKLITVNTHSEGCFCNRDAGCSYCNGTGVKVIETVSNPFGYYVGKISDERGNSYAHYIVSEYEKRIKP